jgi:hypothetical protein
MRRCRVGNLSPTALASKSSSTPNFRRRGVGASNGAPRGSARLVRAVSQPGGM